ncbi:O-antigen ligase family protein [Sphingomonas sp. SUN019]|uniref:O-antigen ligase family protein n=1 Tax=Sphingomonas sp. SUN019 TaxID=2937788 RepID=UPI0021642F89|nr:O-antigen ligase family protein [Sphingomonas sp. SUN019]UVO51479.1 O-antigen ligase family protein [Sphingomonas sp. SUN019]
MPPIAMALIGGMVLLALVTAKAAIYVVAATALGLAIFHHCLTPPARRQLGYQPIVIALVMPLAAWLMPSVTLLYAVMGAMIPLMVRRGGQVAPIYLFSLLLLPPLDQTIMIGSLKLFDFGVHDALACGATITLLRYPDRRAARGARFDMPFFAVLVLLIAMTARETSFTNFFRVMVNATLDCALPYYIISRSVRNMDDVRNCMLHLAAVATVLSLILLLEVWKSWPIYNELYGRHGVEMLLLVKSRGGMIRAGGPFLEPTSIAMILVFCFLAAWMARDAFRSRALHRCLLALLLVGLLAPQSRGAWIGLVTGLTLIDLYRARVTQAAARVVLIGLAGVGLMTLAQNSRDLSESVGLSGASVESADYRERLLERGIEEFWHSPLLGYSNPEILARLSDLRQGEGIVDFVNTYVFIALASGVVGLMIFNGTFVFYLVQLWRRRGRWRRGGPAQAGAAAFAFAGLGTPMEMLFFTSLGGRTQVFLIVFFALAAAVLRIGKVGGVQWEKKGSSAAFAISPMPIPAPPAPSNSSSSPALNNPAR